jgi:hypothetical protein
MPIGGAFAGAAASGSGTGLAGALGFGGGAGLFGLGAATLPILGGAALGIGLLLNHFLGRSHIVPFTRDPHDERERTFFYETAPAVLGRLSDSINMFTNKFEPVTPGKVVQAGLPTAINADPSLRQKVNSVLQADV